MALKYSTTLRNNQLDQIEVTIGTSAKLRLYSGSAPADCASAATGSLLVEMTLPSNWMNDAAAGSKTQLGEWAGVGLAAAGTGVAIGYFRVVDSAGTTCHVQGTVTVLGGGGDMTVSNVSIANTQAISVTSFTISAQNG